MLFNPSPPSVMEAKRLMQGGAIINATATMVHRMASNHLHLLAPTIHIEAHGLRDAGLKQNCRSVGSLAMAHKEAIP